MALPDYIKREFGTPIIWGEAGADGVTKTLSLNGLATTKARMGVYADLGAIFDDEYVLRLIVETGTGPTAGNCVYCYMAETDDTNRWPGGVTGADAAYKDGEEEEWLAQLGIHAVHLVATADADVAQGQEPVIWRPAARYVAPVVQNVLGQSFRTTDPASNNLSRVIAIPRRLLAQDAA